VSTTPIEFEDSNGRRIFGFRAKSLPMVCGFFIDALENKQLLPGQVHIGERCKILIRGLATVGIIAMVDEATGYQDVRAREALAKILDEFLKNELGKWAKRFPDEFYREMFRLRGWRWNPFSVRRPSVVGHLTVDVVYKRLAPGVLNELKLKAERNERGKLKRHYHRWLTEDVGHPRLQEHLSATIALMKVSENWDQFTKMLDVAKPRWSPQLTLQFIRDL
jgi:hypothetical protein